MIEYQRVLAPGFSQGALNTSFSDFQPGIVLLRPRFRPAAVPLVDIIRHAVLFRFPQHGVALRGVSWIYFVFFTSHIEPLLYDFESLQLL